MGTGGTSSGGCGCGCGFVVAGEGVFDFINNRAHGCKS